MNVDEANEVAGALLSAGLHGTPLWTDEQAAVWYDHLRDIPASVGMEAARTIAAAEIDWPDFAKFRAVAMAVNRSGPATGRCECGDTGLVAVGSGTDEFHPCGRCNPEGYDRWRKGRYRPKFAGITPAQAELAGEHVSDLKAGLARIGRQEA